MSYVDKPTAAVILSIIGGALGLVASLFLIGVSASMIIPPLPPSILNSVRALILLFGWLFICAVVVMVCGVMLYFQPEIHPILGTIILVFAVLGGFNVLGIVGGALAISWKHASARSYSPTFYGTLSVCPTCKRVIPYNTDICPYCQTRIR